MKSLCCLGAGGLVSAPTLLRELRKVVPAASGALYYERPGSRFGVYQESPEAAALMAQPEVQHALYAEAFGAHPNTVFQPMGEVIPRERGPVHIRQTLRRDWSDYLDSQLYRLFLKPAGQHSFIRLQIWDGAERLGMLGVYRDSKDRDFGDDEVLTMQQLAPFLTHAFTSRSPPDLSEAEAGDSALIVTDTQGKPRWMSADAKRQLSLVQDTHDAVLPSGVLRAISNLTAASAGNGDTRAPVWECQNAWGRFVFRAYWLTPVLPGAHDDPQASIGVTVSREVPRVLRLFEALGRWPLPARQREVALRLALGRSQDQIAQELGLSRNTVIYHRRQIYGRLGVETRESLLRLLLKDKIV